MRGLHIAGGYLLTGMAYAVIAGSRLHALPGWALLAGGCAAGALLALPVLPGLVLTAIRKTPVPERPLIEVLLTSMGFAAALLAVANTVTYLILRRVASGMGVANEPSTFWQVGTFAAGLAFAVALALGGARVGRALSARQVRGPRVLRWMLALVALGGLVLGAAPREDYSRRKPEDLLPAELPRDGVPRDVPKKILIVVDGLGVDLFERYAARMPRLSAFAAGASRGRMVSDPDAPILSVPIWNAVATGLPASRHRLSMYEFFIDDPRFRTIQVAQFIYDPVPALLAWPVVLAWKMGWVSILPATRFHREGMPFWEEPRAGKVAVVCWPGTWPASRVKGLLVSDRWPPDKNDGLSRWRTLDHRVDPMTSERGLETVRRKDGEPPDAELLAMAPDLLPEERLAFLASGQDLSAPTIPKAEPLNSAYYSWIEDRSCLAAGRWALEHVKPELLVIYTLGVDNTAHALFPDANGIISGFDAEESKRLEPLLGNYLARLDQDLGELLTAGDESTIHIFLSDHSMAPIENNMLFGNWHEGDGMALAQGPGYGPGKPLGNRPPEGFRALLLP